MDGWRSYIGLPHAFGADPRDGVGADCLIVAFAVLDELGMSHPAVDPHWFEMAESGDWEPLKRAWEAETFPVDAPEEGAVTLMDHGAGGLGVATVVDSGLLMVHHRRGVRWIPLRLLNDLQYRKFR